MFAGINIIITSRELSCYPSSTHPSFIQTSLSHQSLSPTRYLSGIPYHEVLHHCYPRCGGGPCRPERRTRPGQRRDEALGRVPLQARRLLQRRLL